MRTRRCLFVAALLIILCFNLSDAGTNRPGARPPVGPPPGSVSGTSSTVNAAGTSNYHLNNARGGGLATPTVTSATNNKKPTGLVPGSNSTSTTAQPTAPKHLIGDPPLPQSLADLHAYLSPSPGSRGRAGYRPPILTMFPSAPRHLIGDPPLYGNEIPANAKYLDVGSGEWSPAGPDFSKVKLEIGPWPYGGSAGNTPVKGPDVVYWNAVRVFNGMFYQPGTSMGNLLAVGEVSPTNIAGFDTWVYKGWDQTKGVMVYRVAQISPLAPSWGSWVWDFVGGASATVTIPPQPSPTPLAQPGPNLFPLGASHPSNYTFSQMRDLALQWAGDPRGGYLTGDAIVAQRAASYIDALEGYKLAQQEKAQAVVEYWNNEVYALASKWVFDRAVDAAMQLGGTIVAGGAAGAVGVAWAFKSRPLAMDFTAAMAETGKLTLTSIPGVAALTSITLNSLRNWEALNSPPLPGPPSSTSVTQDVAQKIEISAAQGFAARLQPSTGSLSQLAPSASFGTSSALGVAFALVSGGLSKSVKDMLPYKATVGIDPF